MPITVLSEWFLLEVKKYIAQIKAILKRFLLKLRRIFEAITRISFLRLLFLVLKRIISIIKSALRYFFISLSISALEFLYVLHFARAYLRIINYFSEANNKNSAELIKLLLSIFKIFISLLMLSVLIVATAYGISPLLLLSLPAYGVLKTCFRVYSGIKFAISLVTLIGSYYRREVASKRRGDNLEEAWLRAQYKDNYWKHVPMLVIGVSTTILLALLSFVGISGLGPIGFITVIVLACSFLLIDITKSIYDFYDSTKVPEPKVGTLEQKNSLIDYSFKDYYYRKCRIARLESDDPEANHIYLLKEIVVKIIQLKAKLENNSALRFSFFSEKQKLQEKIEGLKQQANVLLSDDYAENKALFKKLIESFKKDYQELNENDKTLIPKVKFEILKASLKASFDEILYARDRPRGITHLQSFRQAFFRKKGDCEDISDACQKLKELEQSELSTETRLQTFPVRRMTQCILVAG
jgi:hypothetical protein